MPVAYSKKIKTTDGIFIFSDLFQKTGFDISIKLSPVFRNKNIIKLLSDQIDFSVVEFNLRPILY